MLESAMEWMRPEAPSLLILLATALAYAAERRVHSYNYSYLNHVGAEELIPELLKRYYRYVKSMPFLCYGFSLFLPESIAPWKASLPGFLLIIFGFALRIWSMRSLGRLWTERCLYVADMPRFQRGPYRYLRHPEYLARAIEGLGFILFFPINPLSLWLWYRSITIALRIVKTEDRQLQELSGEPLQLPRDKGKVTFGAS